MTDEVLHEADLLLLTTLPLLTEASLLSGKEEAGGGAGCGDNDATAVQDEHPTADVTGRQENPEQIGAVMRDIEELWQRGIEMDKHLMMVQQKQ